MSHFGQHPGMMGHGHQINQGGQGSGQNHNQPPHFHNGIPPNHPNQQINPHMNQQMNPNHPMAGHQNQTNGHPGHAAAHMAHMAAVMHQRQQQAQAVAQQQAAAQAAAQHHHAFAARHMSMGGIPNHHPMANNRQQNPNNMQNNFRQGPNVQNKHLSNLTHDRNLSLPDDVFHQITSDLDTKKAHSNGRTQSSTNFEPDDLQNIELPNIDDVDNNPVNALLNGSNNASMSNQGNNGSNKSADKTSATQHVGKKSRPNHSLIEKRRRDKMKAYIQELASMVPLCSAIAQNKLDKFTVLRLALQHIKSIIGSRNGQAQPIYTPSFVSAEELRSLMLAAADGFVMIVDCEQGQVLFASKSVKNVLGMDKSEMVGRSLFDMIATDEDIHSFKKYLITNESGPRERLIDIKTGVSIHQDNTNLGYLQTGSHRSFLTRLRRPPPTPMLDELYPKYAPVQEDEENDSGNGVSEPPKKRSKKKSGWVTSGAGNSTPVTIVNQAGYIKPTTISGKVDVNDETFPVSIFGYLRTMSSYNGVLEGCEDQEEVLNELEKSNGQITEQQKTCFVCVVRPLDQIPAKPKTLPLRALQFSYRLNLDGKLVSTDERITSILGYLQQDMKKTSIYDYIHRDDINAFTQSHEAVLDVSHNDKILTKTYHLRTSTGTFVPVRSKMFCFKNPFTNKPQYIVCQSVVDVNKLKDEKEQRKEGELFNSAKHPTRVSGMMPGAAKIGNILHKKAKSSHKKSRKSVVRNVPSPLANHTPPPMGHPLLPPELTFSSNRTHQIPNSAVEIFDKIADAGSLLHLTSEYASAPVGDLGDFDSDLLSSIVKHEPGNVATTTGALVNALDLIANLGAPSLLDHQNQDNVPKKPKSPDSGCESHHSGNLKVKMKTRSLQFPPGPTSSSGNTSDSDSSSTNMHLFPHKQALAVVDQQLNKLHGSIKLEKPKTHDASYDDHHDQMDLLLGVIEAQ